MRVKWFCVSLGQHLSADELQRQTSKAPKKSKHFDTWGFGHLKLQTGTVFKIAGPQRNESLQELQEQQQWMGNLTL